MHSASRLFWSRLLYCTVLVVLNVHKSQCHVQRYSTWCKSSDSTVSRWIRYIASGLPFVNLYWWLMPDMLGFVNCNLGS